MAKYSKSYLRFALFVAAMAISAHLRLAVAIEAADTSYDFGAVKQGERVVHNFHIKNTLTIPLKIARIDLSAPGMTTRVKPVIDPGTTGEIEIAWNTAKVARDVTARATVHFLGDQRPDLTLVLSGRVTPEIEAIPLAGFYISLFKDESAENSITLISHLDHPLVISKVDSQSLHFSASLETSTPGQAYKLVAKIPAGLQPGRYAETIDLRTDDQNNPTIHIPVNILVKDVVYASQSAVDFGDIDFAQLRAHPELQQTFSHVVVVRSRSRQFEIKSIASDVAGLRVSHTPQFASQSFELQFGLEPEALRPGAFAGNIRILTTDPVVPELTVAVRGNIK